MASTEMEDYFAHASDRLLSGESLERIIVDYPAAVRQELQALLAVVELADQVAMIKPPLVLGRNSPSSRYPAISHPPHGIRIHSRSRLIRVSRCRLPAG